MGASTMLTIIASVIIYCAVGGGWLLAVRGWQNVEGWASQAGAPSTGSAARPAVVEARDGNRHARLAALREKAQTHIAQERLLFSESELSDIESRYKSAHDDLGLGVRRPTGLEALEELIQRYPRSNRAGCATMELALASSGAKRERYLRRAIANYSDAWFENGSQVGALSRAMLAVHLAGLDRFDEAETVARELRANYAGSVDLSCAPLDDVLEAVKLLKRV